MKFCKISVGNTFFNFRDLLKYSILRFNQDGKNELKSQISVEPYSLVPLLKKKHK